jgi:ElaB/YqjD/DUF883 family membrane-anchored ribosome-binding protein
MLVTSPAGGRAGTGPAPRLRSVTGGTTKRAETAMDQSIEGVRRDLELTRARMSETVDELANRITQPVQVLRQRLDARRAVREHPWLALGVAIAAGVLLGSTRADVKAARATTAAARRAGSAARGGAVALLGKVRRRGDGAGDDDGAPAGRGFLAKLGDQLADVLEGPLAEVVGEVRRASEEIAGVRPPPT